MRVELVLASLGALIYLGSVGASFLSAQKMERNLRSSRIPISTYTAFLEYLNFALSIYLAGTGIAMLLDLASTRVDWTLPLLFLVCATIQGFPKGILVRPGLTDSGLVLLGTLYKWNYFTAYERLSNDRIKLLYRKAWLGIRSLNVRVPKVNLDSFVALMEKNGVFFGGTET